MDVSEPFFLFLSLALSRLWGRRQETAMFRLTLWRLLLDVWYPNRPLSHWTAERHFSQEVLGEPAVCPAYTNSELSWAEKDGQGPCRMEVFRVEEKMFNVSSTQGSINNPCSPQRICSDSVHMLQKCPATPTRPVKDWIVGNAEQESNLNKWSCESQAWSQELVPFVSHK